MVQHMMQVQELNGNLLELVKFFTMRYIEEQKPLVVKNSGLNPLALLFECNNGAEEENDKQTKIEETSPVEEVSNEWHKVINGRATIKSAETVQPRYQNKHEIL